MNSEQFRLSELDKLARLMSTENIVVQHGSVKTAYFDLQNRTLMLPMWKDISKSLYHMLVSHEIGHALYTPETEWKQMIGKEPHLQAYANILEDARIEKLVKAKYPGCRRDFREGYAELLQKDFFGLKQHNVQIDQLTLTDRINLHYKIGETVKIPFASRELKWLDRVEKLVTFEDVIQLARELYKEHRNQSQNPQGGGQEQQGQSGQGKKDKGKNQNQQESGEGSGEEAEGQEADGQSEGKKPIDPNHRDPSKGLHSAGQEDEEGEDEDGEGEGQEGESEEDIRDPEELNEGQAGSSSGRVSNTDLGGAATTQSNTTNVDPFTNSGMESGISNRIVDLNAKPFKYLNLDTAVPTEEFIIPYTEVLEEVRRVEVEQPTNLQKSYGKHFKRLNGRNRNAVNYLIKEFELRKAADRVKRTKVTKTGVLNPTRLHAYKFTDDIFRRGEYVADGKNHAICMFVDFSGSMNDIMSPTIEHLFNLVSFCRKANIPHRVFAFTNASFTWRKKYRDRDIYATHDGRRAMLLKHVGNRSSVLTANLDMSLLELYNNSMSLGEFRAMTEALVENFERRSSYYSRPFRMFDLNSTPLDGSIVLAHRLMREFKEKTKTEIVSAIFLTDGDSSGACLLNRSSASDMYNYCDDTTILQKKHKSFRMKTSGNDYMTSLLLQSLADDGFHVIGYRVGTEYDLTNQINYSVQQDTTKAQKHIKELKESGATTLVNFRGYQEYHYLTMQAAKNSSNFKLGDTYEDNDAVAEAFMAETTGRLFSRRILQNIAKKVSGKTSP